MPAGAGTPRYENETRSLDVVGATLPLWIPASARMTNPVAGDNYFRTNDEVGGRFSFFEDAAFNWVAG